MCIHEHLTLLKMEIRTLFKTKASLPTVKKKEDPLFVKSYGGFLLFFEHSAIFLCDERQFLSNLVSMSLTSTNFVTNLGLSQWVMIWGELLV